ncbi:MAG: hypothetical protein ABI779_13250 [Acidobacteriota bacterium]
MIQKRLNRQRQRGFILTIELLFLAAILVIGLIVGMTTVRDAVVLELSDLSEAVGALNQGYRVAGVVNDANTASTAGSQFSDASEPTFDTGSGIALVEVSFIPAISENAPPPVPIP